MKRILLILFACLSWLLGCTQIVTLAAINPVADSYTDSGNPSSTAGGSSSVLKVSKTASSTFRSFLKFDIPSLPSDAVITSAILKLTPSGRESVSASSSELYLEMCHNSWLESSLSHATNISNNVVFSTVNFSNLISSKREFQVKDYVQAIIEGNVPNNGWRIRRSDESINAVAEYFSRETATVENRPQLVIQYYSRAYVSTATIVHASTANSSDGSISPTVVQGSSAMTYRWYNSAGTQIGTSQNLLNAGKGWYGMKCYGSTAGDTTYQAFIVGVKCEHFSLTFNPGPKYIDDTYLYNWVSGSGTTLADYSQTNVGDYGYEATFNWYNSMWYAGKTLMRFRLWIDPQLIIGTAKLKLSGYDHYSSAVPNTSELLRATSNWSEYGATYRSVINTTTTGKIVVPAVPNGTANAFIELKPFFDTWKTNNAQNYGMLFQLQTQNATDYFRMMFYSADAASGRPEISLTVGLVDNACTFPLSFVELSDQTDAGFAVTSGNTLKFFFEEEYSIDTGKKLPLKIYNEDHTAIAGIDFNGAAIPGLTLLPAINYLTDKNFVSLSLSGVSLTAGKFYTLELTTTLGEKKYLKFKYTN